MRLFLLEFAIRRYDKKYDRLGLRHAGFTSYADEKDKIVARRDARGLIRSLDSKSKEKAQRARDKRRSKKKKISGRVID